MLYQVVYDLPHEPVVFALILYIYIIIMGPTARLSLSLYTLLDYIHIQKSLEPAAQSA